MGQNPPLPYSAALPKPLAQRIDTAFSLQVSNGNGVHVSYQQTGSLSGCFMAGLISVPDSIRRLSYDAKIGSLVASMVFILSAPRNPSNFKFLRRASNFFASNSEMISEAYVTCLVFGCLRGKNQHPRTKRPSTGLSTQGAEASFLLPLSWRQWSSSDLPLAPPQRRYPHPYKHSCQVSTMKFHENQPFLNTFCIHFLDLQFSRHF